ncbi:hypothetical protein, partial [Aeromonas sp.]|uniref:hypothetical protein n=1 Tax=Aeromonas sp. TaxID=647 RepID=UPI0025835ABA
EWPFLAKLDMPLMWGVFVNPSRANTKKIFSRTMNIFDGSPVSRSGNRICAARSQNALRQMQETSP